MRIKSFISASALIFLLAGCTSATYSDPKLPRAFKGGSAAAVLVEEFGDFQCPACGQAYTVTKPLVEKFGNSVQWRFYHYPLTSIHPYAFNAAMASECAHDQGKFWEYHDRLFENQDDLTRGDLRKHAQAVGLQMESFNACFDSRTKSDLVRGDMALGGTRNIKATPTFFVNGKLIEGWTGLESIITVLLADAAGTSPTSTPQQ